MRNITKKAMTKGNEGTQASDQEQSDRIRVFAVDDHEVVLRGLRLLFKENSDIDLVGEAFNGAEALERMEKLKPNVILIDIKLPDMDGFKVVRQIKDSHPDIFAIMLTGYESGLFLSEAIQAGANGVVTKDCSGRFLCNAIRMVAEGGTAWDTKLLRDSVRELSGMTKIDIALQDSETSLQAQFTSQDEKILALVAQGTTNKEIAVRLGIAPDTVKKRITTLIHKLGVSNRTQAAIISSRLGLTNL
jgi:DNA-binding NarL/FixJ family response regulator